MSPAAGNGPIRIGGKEPLLLIAGPCVLESEQLALEVGQTIRDIAANLGIGYVFKASFDKANRTSLTSFRGPGLAKGLALLQRVKDKLGVPVTSDVHELGQVKLAADVLDIIQIPAFLCRQTDLLVAAGESGRIVNIKKGQFMSPWDMRYAVDKVRATGNEQIFLTERGSSFGYNNLVVDMRGLPIMRSLGCPVVYDATHSVQLPGGGGGQSSGQRHLIPALSRSAVAAGVDGIFMEVHPDPDRALCDGPNSLPLASIEPLLRILASIHTLVAPAL